MLNEDEDEEDLIPNVPIPRKNRYWTKMAKKVRWLS